MKKLFLFLMIGLVTSVLTSCLDDDEYDPYDDTWIGIGLVHIDEDTDILSIELDSGEILYPINDESLTVEDSARVLVNFIIEEELVSEPVEEYSVTIYSIKDILFKDIIDITEEIEDSIGNDAINVEEAWQTNNMLTLYINHWGLDQTHYVNLVKEPGELTSESQPVELELRHNDNDDSPMYNVSSYVTFDLSAIQIAGQDSTAYTVTCTEYGGETYTYEDVYFY